MTSVRDTLERLRSAQKPSRGAPAYSRYINRPLGRLLAAVAYSLGLSPNAVTIVSGAATLTGIALLATVPPGLAASIAVTALLVLGYALDSADGQVARLRGISSYSGEWLDHIIDAIKIATIHTAVLIAWWRWFDLDDLWLLVPVAFQISASVFFFGVVLSDLLRRIAYARAREEAPAKSGRTSLLYSLAVVPADYGLLCLVFIVFWVQPVFVTVYTLLAVVNVLLLVLSLFRWFRSIRGLDEGA